MIGNFLKKLAMGLILYVSYTLEIILIMVPIEEWLDLGWDAIVLEGNPFFNGIGWLFLFIFVTLWCITITAIVVEDPS